MSFGSQWGSMLPASFRINKDAQRASNGKISKKAQDEFDREFETYISVLKAQKAAKEAAETETKTVEETPVDVIAEEAYQAFVKEDEEQTKPKSRKKKTEVVEETSAETIEEA